MLLQHILEVSEAFYGAIEAGVHPLVLVAEADPVAQVVAEGFIPGAEIVLLYVQLVDAYGGLAALEVERPVGF